MQKCWPLQNSTASIGLRNMPHQMLCRSCGLHTRRAREPSVDFTLANEQIFDYRSSETEGFLREAVHKRFNPCSPASSRPCHLRAARNTRLCREPRNIVKSVAILVRGVERGIRIEEFGTCQQLSLPVIDPTSWPGNRAKGHPRNEAVVMCSAA